MSVNQMFHLVSWNYFETPKNMAAYCADGSVYHSYDLSIYCHDVFFYKPAYKIDRVFAYLDEIYYEKLADNTLIWNYRKNNNERI